MDFGRSSFSSFCCSLSRRHCTCRGAGLRWWALSWTAMCHWLLIHSTLKEELLVCYVLDKWSCLSIFKCFNCTTINSLYCYSSSAVYISIYQENKCYHFMQIDQTCKAYPIQGKALCFPVLTWLVSLDGEPGIEYMLSSLVTLVEGRGVLGSLTTASVTYFSAHPIRASKNSRNVI